MAKTTGTQKTSLFDADTLYETTPLGSQNRQPPVTCLGKTFATDDERREYFRTVLREKLPELKKLDGYPIGEDDDIINLSDPPYYTACPNPWLNDFVAEWEAEKPQLEKKGLRKADFTVTDPYASDVSEGKNNPIYNAHSYHTKVPHPAIMRYILHYTQPGDIILDGFAGTGMTGVAAQMCGHPDIDLKNKIENEFKINGYTKPTWGKRKGICTDLSPIAFFISSNYNRPVNIATFNQQTKVALDKAKKECNWVYETNHTNMQKGLINYVVWSDIFICPNCGQEINYLKTAYDKSAGSLLNVITCPHCGERHEKKDYDLAWITQFDQIQNKTTKKAKSEPYLINYTYKNKRYDKIPDKDDKLLINKIDDMKIPYWFPVYELPKGDKMGDPLNKGITKVYQFYTKRNLYVLSCLWNLLDLEHKWLLTSSLSRNATKMNRFIINKYNPNGRINGPFTGTLYLPSESVEQNIFDLVSEKTPQRVMESFDNITGVSSATALKLNDNSIDYIFTDPPFGHNIMYSELNFINESWLKIKTNNIKEAVENRTQRKQVLDYFSLMKESFNEYNRVLKPNHWMTVEFSNTSAAIWNCIHNAIQSAGFIIANITSLDKQHGGIKSMTYDTAVKQDLVISCYKPSTDFELRFTQQDGITNTWSFIDEQLAHLPLPEIKEEKSTAIIERSPKILYDRLITFFLMRNLPVPLDASDFQEGLKKRYSEKDGMVFTAAQLAQYLENKKKHNIADGQTLFNFEMIITESDAIQWCKYKLEKTPLKYNDLQPDFRKANAMTRKGEDPIELKTVLEENFIKNNDDTWRVPDLNEAKDRETLRTKALLKEFARYVEDLESGKVRSLKTVRQQAVLAGFKDCYAKKDYELIVKVAEHIPQDLLNEDEMLLNYYDIATDKVGI